MSLNCLKFEVFSEHWEACFLLVYFWGTLIIYAVVWTAHLSYFYPAEGYDLTPLKILSSMKLVYCYCPKFDYFAKSDDDTYTRIDRLNNELPKLQKEIDETAIQFNIYAFKVSKRLPGFRTWVGGGGGGAPYILHNL